MMHLWVIHERPADAPYWYAVRRLTVSMGQVHHDPEVHLALTLEGARALVPPGRMNLGRKEHDEPQIKEIWI